MQLTDQQKRMFEGEYGRGVQRAMSLLVKLGEVFGAERMVSVDRAHILADMPADFMAEMTEGLDKVTVLTTTHASFNPSEMQKLGIPTPSGNIDIGDLLTIDPEVYARRYLVFKRLGILPTFTCTPYLIGFIPRRGEVLSMIGSLGQILVNSVFGATSNREGISAILASAVTGLTPQLNLLEEEKRLATVLVEPEDLDFARFTSSEYGALGYCVGEIAGTSNVVLNGMPSKLSFDQCRRLLPPMAITGAVAMCHIVGVTPEAPSPSVTMGGIRPKKTFKIGKQQIGHALERLNTAEQDQVDLVVIGCPHCTIEQIQTIAFMLAGKSVHANVRLLIGIAQPIYALAKMVGFVDTIEGAGGLFTSSCVSALNPVVALDDSIRVAVTDTVGPAYRLPQLSKGRTKVFFGDTEDCIMAAVKGKWRR